jgi:hypothetical protein
MSPRQFAVHAWVQVSSVGTEGPKEGEMGVPNESIFSG